MCFYVFFLLPPLSYEAVSALIILISGYGSTLDCGLVFWDARSRRGPSVKLSDICASFNNFLHAHSNQWDGTYRQADDPEAVRAGRG